ncbi:DNA-binding response regulator [Streptococcus pneumoniae]|nr:DNA-binding response regulator [Streptococcus pneumoniae]
MNILVADDEEMIREGIAAFLTEEGYHVIMAKDGQEVLEKFQDLLSISWYWI